MSKFNRIMLKLRLFFTTDGPHGDLARGRIYRPYLRKCGKNFKIATNTFIYNPAGLTVGDHVYIGFNSYLGQGEISLDDEVLIGNFVSITASNHTRQKGSYRFGGYEAKPIHIGRGTWIAAHSSIMAGVTLAKGCLVAAGSVVTKSFLEEDMILGGVPAKQIKKVEKI